MNSAQKAILYLLSGLVCITVLAVLGANVGMFGDNKIVANFAQWGLGAVLAEIVGLFVLIVRSNVFSSAATPYTLVISGANKLENFDITQIRWDESQCFVKFGEEAEKVQPVLSTVGPALEVRLSPQIVTKIRTDEPIELSLADIKGLIWEVRPFFLYQSQLKLSPSANRSDIIAAYGDDDE